MDGRWEEAMPLFANEPPPSAGAVRSWVGHSADFALEIFFADAADPPYFVGVRWGGKTASQVADLVQKAHETLESVRAESVARVLCAFDAALGTSLLRFAPSFLEVGVNNLWKSVGSLVIWKHGQQMPSKSQLASELAQRAPQLLLDQPNAIMLEIGYVDPQPHWLGLCTSHRRGDRYQLDLDEILTIAQEVFEQSRLELSAPG
jgi:hypothetical protein